MCEKKKNQRLRKKKAITKTVGPCKKAFEVSFLVQWPLIAAAFFNSISVRALYRNELAVSFLLSPVVLLTLFSASLIAFFSLWFLQWIVYKKKMWIFSVYFFVPTFLYIFLCQQQ